MFLHRLVKFGNWHTLHSSQLKLNVLHNSSWSYLLGSIPLSKIQLEPLLFFFCTLIFRILNKNLDQCSVIIFDKWKLFHLIDLIPGFTSYRAPGIKAINWTIFLLVKNNQKTLIKVFRQKLVIVPVRLFGRSE